MLKAIDECECIVQSRCSGRANVFALQVLGTIRRSGLEARHVWRPREVAQTDLTGPALLPPGSFQPGRVLMLNAALTCGGAERQLVNTMVGLQQRGWDVRLACERLDRTRHGRFFAPRLAAAGIRYAALGEASDENEADLHRLVGQAVQRLRKLPRPLRRALWPYLQAIVQTRPVVVHAWQDRSNVLAGIAAVIAGVPRVVLSTRNMAPYRFAYHEPYMRSGYRALSSFSQVRIVNNSAAGAADYRQWLALPEDRIAIVRNGHERVPNHDSAPVPSWGQLGLPIPPGVPVVGSVFRFYPEKDPGLWVATAAQVAASRPDCHFVIIGDGPLRETLQTEARWHGIARRLHLPGVLPDPAPYLRRMSVVLLTSQLEGLPNVLIEAQAAGIPVVSTAAGGAAETFVNGETGWLTGNRRPAALAQLVLDVLENPSWSAACKGRASDIASEKFEMKRMLDATLALYAPDPLAGAISASHLPFRA